MQPTPLPPLDYAPTVRRVNKVAICLAIALVFVVHGVLQFVLYRSLFVNQWSITDSEWFIFGLPNLLALSAYAIIFWRAVTSMPLGRGKKIAWVALLTLVTGFFSMWAAMLIPINMYGE
jgi:hypothetical protein